MKRGDMRTVGPLTITRCDRPRSAPWGPMGGGWRWKVGLLGGRDTVIVELIYWQFRITRRRRAR